MARPETIKALKRSGRSGRFRPFGIKVISCKPSLQCGTLKPTRPINLVRWQGISVVHRGTDSRAVTPRIYFLFRIPMQNARTRKMLRVLWSAGEICFFFSSFLVLGSHFDGLGSRLGSSPPPWRGSASACLSMWARRTDGESILLYVGHSTDMVWQTNRIIAWYVCHLTWPLNFKKSLIFH